MPWPWRVRTAAARRQGLLAMQPLLNNKVPRTLVLEFVIVVAHVPLPVSVPDLDQSQCYARHPLFVDVFFRITCAFSTP